MGGTQTFPLQINQAPVAGDVLEVRTSGDRIDVYINASANVLRSSSAQSNRGVSSFFGSSTVAAKDGLSSSGSGLTPARGSS